MKRKHVLSGYFMGMLFLTFIFSGFKADRNSVIYPSNETIIDMYLDSIGTGPITQKQLLSVKKLVVMSNGISYGIKSFDIGLISNGGPGHYAHCFGALLSPAAMNIFKYVKPKDMILIGNLKFFNLDKFKQDPHAKPIWTVVADK